MRKRLAFVLAIAGAVAAQTPSRQPTAQEKRLLVTSAAVERWWPDLDPKPQTFRSVQDDRVHSLRIISEYDTRGKVGYDEPLFFLSDVEIFPTKAEAARWFMIKWAKTKEGWQRSKDITIEDFHALLTMGDDHYAGVIK